MLLRKDTGGVEAADGIGNAENWQCFHSRLRVANELNPHANRNHHPMPRELDTDTRCFTAPMEIMIVAASISVPDILRSRRHSPATPILDLPGVEMGRGELRG
jgi:hypothetical protein